jgi:hypothetical protein
MMPDCVRMIKSSSQNRINIRVREGSALERLIRASSSKTVSGALHDIAAAFEAMKGSK